ncbi:hypothetical protein JTB14_036662 [Gonioctena quinquepunctata]|nr:hypothetical protein JTB14_036662 [Gonioctena quinquepunctata]
MPAEIVSLIKSYLHNRRLVSGNYTVVAKNLSKGCPQGSVLGPLLWNLTLDPLLRIQWPEGVQLTAYADDVACSIHAPNRRILEYRANLVLSTLGEWVGQHKLTIYLPKTKYVVFSKLSAARNPVVRMGNVPISRVDCIKCSIKT